jgi:hypothetical protein
MRCTAAALLLACGAVPAAAPALAQDFDPATLDLPALVECRKTVPEYNSFGFWLATEPGAADRLDWVETQQPNLFLREFRMKAAVEVFGHASATVAFTPTGPMLVLDGVSAPDLAASLGLPVFHASGEKFLAEKVVYEAEEKDGSLTARSRIAINVSTVDTHPGKVLAGCSYTFEIG